MGGRGKVYRLFDVFGVEIEYMLVDVDSLEVKPVADEVLRRLATGSKQSSEHPSEVVRGELEWSNELVRHVLELKVKSPKASLLGLDQQFQAEVRFGDRVARSVGARLLPGAMHPWMDPLRQTELWPHGGREFYQTFDRIFNCKGHGWSNLQSMHLNLPFHGDQEFGRLHAAVRLALPLLPALASASPFMEGAIPGPIDVRLSTYRTNCARIPEVTGRVIPEPVYTQADYQATILEPMYRAIVPFDPEEVLREEWLNARGAIARFERNTIEVRVIDAQECPAMDIAVAAATAAVIRDLVVERHLDEARQRAFDTERLETHLLGAIHDGDRYWIDDAEYLACFGVEDKAMFAGALWAHLLSPARLSEDDLASFAEPLTFLVEHGPLARRLLSAFDPSDPRVSLRRLARRLADGLIAGQPFIPD